MDAMTLLMFVYFPLPIAKADNITAYVILAIFLCKQLLSASIYLVTSGFHGGSQRNGLKKSPFHKNTLLITLLITLEKGENFSVFPLILTVLRTLTRRTEGNH